MSALSAITLYSIGAWVLFGIISGLIAHLIDSQDVRGGLLGTAFIGVLGALIGGFLASAFFGGITGFNITSFAIAVVGSLLVAFIYRFLGRNRDHIKTHTTNFL